MFVGLSFSYIASVSFFPLDQKRFQRNYILDAVEPLIKKWLTNEIDKMGMETLPLMFVINYISSEERWN